MIKLIITSIFISVFFHEINAQQVTQSMSVSCSTSIKNLNLNLNQKCVLGKNLKTKLELENKGKCLYEEQINYIINAVSVKRWNDYQGYTAINLYSQLNNKLRTTKDTEMNNKLNLEIDSYVDNVDVNISNAIGIPKSKPLNDSRINLLFKKYKITWKTYEENNDSIDYYYKTNSYEKLELFLNKITE